jgi:hypothetical protein
MSRYIDADGLIADMQERYCKPCKERKEDYNEVRCRVCWVDDATDDVDVFGDNGIDIVRCKECKYYIDNMPEDSTDDECRWRSEEQPNPDDFCSYGERKEP